MRLLCKNGSFRWFEATARIIFDESGNPQKVIGSIVDITDKKLHESDLQQNIESLNKQNQLLGQFVYTASHNLRTHIANITGLVAICKEQEDQNLQATCIDKIGEAAERLQSTLSHLTEMLKTKENFKPEREMLVISEVCDFVLALLEPGIRKLHAEVIVDFSVGNNLFYIYAYLESILLNLITNALRYSFPNRTPKILIRTFFKDNRCHLSVSDNGIGIDLEKFGKKLFQLNQTFHGNTDARGVGLYLVKNQVESLGGFILVESTPNEGSCFTITF
jgi:signal transduction histidine kinase